MGVVRSVLIFFGIALFVFLVMGFIIMKVIAPAMFPTEDGVPVQRPSQQQVDMESITQSEPEATAQRKLSVKIGDRVELVRKLGTTCWHHEADFYEATIKNTSVSQENTLLSGDDRPLVLDFSESGKWVKVSAIDDWDDVEVDCYIHFDDVKVE